MNIYIYADKDYSIWDTSSSTFCYYPFSDNNTDSTWNTTLSAWWTKQTLWYNFNYSWTTINFSKTLTWTRFCSFRFKWISWDAASNNLQVGIIWIWRMCLNFSHTGSWYPKTIQSNIDGNWQKYWPVYTIWQWVHLAYWYNWTEAYCYVNWVKTTIATWSTPWSSETESKFIGSQYTGSGYTYSFNIADFIIDTVDRESEIVPHFNATKSLYWIS